jgi:hypothetical protein
MIIIHGAAGFGNTSFATYPPSGAGSGIISASSLASIIGSGGGTAGADPLFGSLISGFKAVNVRTAGPDGKVGTADDTFVPVPVIRAAIQAAPQDRHEHPLRAEHPHDGQPGAEIQVGRTS